MGTKLYVGNLNYQTTEEDLRDLFGAIGEVESVSVVTDRDTGRPRGFAFVEMSSDREAQEAIRQLDGKVVDERTIKVNEARPREDRRSGGPRGRRGGNDSRRDRGDRGDRRRRS
ncbi:MAG: RNA-binding protein [Chloroflexota bacterium]|nr:RNA-binding protein [Chloroflexota bacterium]